MSYPHSVFNNDSPKIRKANWLGRYLEVEGKASNEIHSVLEDAERSIVRHLATIGTEGIGGEIRRVQLNIAMRAVRTILRGTFGSVTDIVRDKQQKAAVAAVDAGLFDERGILHKLFPNSIDRQNYAESLRETAQRNIQSTITRVLKTEQPLSARVWKTNALANNMVSKAVNNALARGDSAENLAREVRKLIRPDVPGGVSYAAMRLARTEINNAFHAQSISDVQSKPWVHQMRWNLSKVHEEDPGDACELYAQIGLFDKERIPVKPHPNCRCFVTADLPDYQEFEDNLVLGHYNAYLDDVMGTGYGEASISPLRKQEGFEQPEIHYTPLPDEPSADDELLNFSRAQSVSDIAMDLSNRYGIDVDSDLGFNDVEMDIKVARELANQLVLLQDKYPEVNIMRMENIDFLDDRLYAMTYPVNGHGSRIAFNSKYHASYRDFVESASEDTSFHPPGAAAQPAKSTMTHEFGHALINQTEPYLTEQDLEHSKLQSALWNECFSVTTGVPDLPEEEEFKKWWAWMRKNMSGYSFIDGDTFDINDHEALAEAFDDVERNGDKALAGSKVLYRVLMEARRSALKESAARLAYSASKRGVA